MGMETEENALIALMQKSSKQKTKDNHKKNPQLTGGEWSGWPSAICAAHGKM